MRLFVLATAVCAASASANDGANDGANVDPDDGAHDAAAWVYVDGDWDGVVLGEDTDDGDPCVPSRDSSRCDQDDDGVDNGLERGRGTDEFAADSDGDGVSDFDEGDDDRNGNGVVDGRDVCVPGPCSDEDAVEVVEVAPAKDADAANDDGGGGCSQSTSPPLGIAALLLLLLAHQRIRRPVARVAVRLARWTAPRRSP